jgi:uncharacterized SAM-binding protein YcdF (DUF218 family)/glycosyltransferase involved in cell wall biosynthesis
MPNHDYLIISSIDWSDNWQLHQQLANSLVESGNRVLFIENTGVRTPQSKDFSRIRIRIQNWIKSTRGFFDIKENLTVFSPVFIPLPYSRFAIAINNFLLSRSIEKWLKIKQFKPPVVISFLPTPLSQVLIRSINPLATIYYCANDMSLGSNGARKLKNYEDIFFCEVDAVFCISNSLLERAIKLNKRSFLFPAGVDFGKFQASSENDKVPADLIAIEGPVVGYIGAISHVFDQELIVYAARALPKINFVLIGPIVSDISLLNTCQNIILLGSRSHNEVPRYIKGFTVALIPYLKNSFTDAVYSCKLNEYMAMGVQVVATNTRELRHYVERHGNVLEITESNVQFVQKILQAIVTPNETMRLDRIAAAKENSWDQRFRDIYAEVGRLLIEKSTKRLDWQSRLVNYYRKSRIEITKISLFLVFCYGILFHTPIVWFAGDQLVVRHKPREVDAIVVFSGDGETSYINQSYQRRTLDAIKYFKSGFAPLIILSSGKDQTFSEVEIIRSLLVNRGVPANAIEILEKYPRSTFENVEFVKRTLRDHKAESILLITSPYHSRRALWIWRRAMPELDILAPEVADSPSSSPVWSSSIDQIRIISYEYLAIAYNWWKSWL